MFSEVRALTIIHLSFFQLLLRNSYRIARPLRGLRGLLPSLLLKVDFNINFVKVLRENEKKELRGGTISFD